MTDTVTRLMGLADAMANAYARRCLNALVPGYAEKHEEARQALEAELVRLFTPLSADEKLRIALDCNMRVRTGSGAYKYATAIEAAHGIEGQYAHLQDIPGLRVDPVTGNVGIGERNDRPRDLLRPA